MGPMTESSEAWMDDLNEGCAFDESDEESSKDEKETETVNVKDDKEELKSDSLKDSDTIDNKSSIGLPMTEASDTWMDDLEEGGGFDDSDDDVSSKENVILEKEEKSVKDKSSIGLPMTEASDAWMDDVGDGGGFDDSEEEIDDKIDKNEKPKDAEIIEKHDSENIAEETDACPVNEEGIVLEAETIVTVEKNSSIGLPMTQASDAWMDDLEGGDGFDDSDEDVTPSENVITEKEEKSVKDVSSIGLPMTEASEAWMRDIPVEDLSNDKTSLGTEVKSSICLPMKEASEAWMDDLGDGCDFEDSDNENGELKLNNISTDAAQIENQFVLEKEDFVETAQESDDSFIKVEESTATQK